MSDQSPGTLNKIKYKSVKTNAVRSGLSLNMSNVNQNKV